jgi:aryl-alcohol dehydrogenase-like predicted oxidoreductase
MNTRQLGNLWPVSALTIGGGGIGQVWGATDRAESVATLREAVDAGITLIDLAPGYGNGEAETVLGETYDGKLPAGVRVTTKCRLGNPPASEVYRLLRESLQLSLERMRLDHVDIFFLHNLIVDEDAEGATTRTSRTLFREAVVPAFERLESEGLIGAWGITGIGVPSAIIETLGDTPAPAAAQCVTNLLDSPGGMARYDEAPRPRDIIAAAKAAGTGVMGIRAVQAGALTSNFDRDLPGDHPEMRDYLRAAPFRAIAAEVGKSPAFLAHQYALSMAGVDTVVLGVKNREELRECLAAEEAGPMDRALASRIDLAMKG